MIRYAKGLQRRAMPVCRSILPVLIAGACLWALQQRLGSGAMADIGASFRQIGLSQWALAIAATIVSFWAIGRYDVVIHRHIGTGCDTGQAATVGAASIALGQMLGMGVFVGALVRWRMLKDLDPVQATRISVTVMASFFFGLVCIFTALSLSGLASPLPVGVALSALFLICFIALRSFLDPKITLFGKRFTLLSLPAFGGVILLSLVDTAAAALALWVLMPQGFEVGFALMFPIYMTALCAALISGTPGGVGPFELTLLLLLPHVPEPEIMSGVFAFRLIYYALPGVLAMIVLCKPYPARATTGARSLQALPDSMLRRAHRSELGLCRQNGAQLLSTRDTALAVVTTPQALVAFFDPLHGPASDAAPALTALARHSNRVPLFYKSSARQAADCRRAGMKALHIADEALLNPVHFSTDGPAFRQLRRKLKQAAKAGVTICEAQHLPVAHLQAIDAEWQARTGRARGFSMGVFCPAYLQQQRVYLAYRKDVLVGFASFHVSDHEICLDLMRPGADAPTGTMHSLVATAIADASAAGCQRFSLAALPPEKPRNPILSFFIKRFRSGGLEQFKSCFAPRREPLYALSPTWTGMALGLVDVAREVHFPNSNFIHIDDEDYEFAPSVQT